MVAIAGTRRCRRSNHFFSDTGLRLRFQNISRAPRASGALVAHSATCDVASIYWTGILCNKAWVQMYIVRFCDHVTDQFSHFELTRGRKPVEMNSVLSG